MPFNFQGKTAFLTYPQCSLSKEDVLGLLNDLLKEYDIKYITVSEEAHEDGNPHIHAFVWLHKQLHTRDQTYFDLGNYHPNIQSARNKTHVIKYVQKDGNFVEEGEKPGKRKWDEVLLANDKTSAITIIKEISPRDWVLAYDRVQRYLEATFPEEKESYTSEFTFSEEQIPSGIREWLGQRHQTDRPKSLIVIGPTRTGKTELCRSFGKHIYWNSYFNLDKLSDDAEYAIFDDIPWERFGYQAKQWLGAQKEFEATDKYKRKQTVKWGKPSIYITNDDFRNLRDGKPQLDNDMLEWLNGNVIFQIIHDKLY